LEAGALEVGAGEEEEGHLTDHRDHGITLVRGRSQKMRKMTRMMSLSQTSQGILVKGGWLGGGSNGLQISE